MGGIDRSDQRMALACRYFKTKVWYRKCFGISWKCRGECLLPLQRSQQKKVSLSVFKCELAKQLIAENRRTTRASATPGTRASPFVTLPDTPEGPKRGKVRNGKRFDHFLYFFLQIFTCLGQIVHNSCIPILLLTLCSCFRKFLLRLFYRIFFYFQRF